jgi:hypothetical protein
MNRPSHPTPAAHGGLIHPGPSATCLLVRPFAQVPAGRAGEPDEAAMASSGRRPGPWQKDRAADLGAWDYFEDESGQGLRPPKGRTRAAATAPRW